MNKSDITISKFLSLVLRHKPQTIGIELDANGWTTVTSLIENANRSGISLDQEMLNRIVATNPKKRFAFDETRQKIRASQGHSLDVDLGYPSQKPPAVLYHGTAVKSTSSILETGLQKQNRQHVHLSVDFETAVQVGQRHGTPAVFEVLAEAMHRDGFVFFIAANGVWLTDQVPIKYLKLKG